MWSVVMKWTCSIFSRGLIIVVISVGLTRSKKSAIQIAGTLEGNGDRMEKKIDDCVAELKGEWLAKGKKEDDFRLFDVSGSDALSSYQAIPTSEPMYPGDSVFVVHPSTKVVGEHLFHEGHRFLALLNETREHLPGPGCCSTRSVLLVVSDPR